MDLNLSSIPPRLAEAGFQLKVLTEAGIVRPMRPDRMIGAARALQAGGTTPATGIKVASIKRPDATFIVDECGSLSFGEVHRRTNALARSLVSRGIGPGDGVGVMCRNHRGFVETTLAASKIGATALYLNTMFSGPQLAEVVEREGPRALVYDDEFEGLLEAVPDGVVRITAWGGGSAAGDSLDRLIAESSAVDLAPTENASRFIILTSGTTGSPKGAQRSSPDSLSALAGLLDRIPHRSEETMVVAAPMFHSWGFINFVIGLPLGAKLVMRRKFDPEETLAEIDRNRADVLIAVPVMLQRILELEPEVRARYRTDGLRITSLSGSSLPGELATDWMDEFGENLYSLYGSTEVAFASIAGPGDLRADPATAGRPPHGTAVRLIGDDGREVRQGQTGRIFVANEMVFEGYTGGGGKQSVEGMLASGDIGHFDSQGRLFIDGRDDEMIVSGGENVFPREVEDLLAEHPDVSEVAIIGVEDEKFGQRLKAFVVAMPGASPTGEALKAHVKKNLASYKAPREVEFLDELPRNATGKVVKRSLQ